MVVYARIADVRDSDKDFERVLFVRLSDTTLYIALDFCFTLFAVT